MLYILYIGIGLVLFFVILLVWGMVRIRRSTRQALREVERVRVADIGPLAKECTDVLAAKLGVQIDTADCDDAARKLDQVFRDKFRLKGAFAKEDFYWYLVKPVGALLGELLRLHADHEWVKEEGKAPFMRWRVKDGESTVWPFEKVIKHITVGDPGNLEAYVVGGRTIAKSGGKGADGIGQPPPKTKEGPV
jgi:hypothetical protein